MKGRIALGALGAALALLVAPAAASAAPTGSITGAVTDANAHQGVVGVRVCAVSEGPFEEIDEFCTHSATAGAYSIGELPPDEYTVEFLSGVEGLNYIYQAWKNQPLSFLGELVEVASGEVFGIDAELAEGGEIGGRVTNFNGGAPLADVEVCAEPSAFYAEQGCAVTNPAGEYTIFGLSSSKYRVSFHPPEGVEFLEQSFDAEPGILQADPVSVTTGQLTPDINATLQEAAQISGTVRDAITGVPIAAVSVCTFATLGNEYIGQCGSSDVFGHYTIRRVPAGVYTIRFFTGESIPRQYREGWYTGSDCGRTTRAVTATAGHVTAGVDVGLFKIGLVEVGLPACEPPVELPPARVKPKKCRKGFHKKKAKGKVRCVKVHKKKHHKRG